MTQRIVNRLLTAQIGKSANRAFELLNKRGLRASPKLLKQIISEQRTHDVLTGVVNNLILSAQKNKKLVKKLVLDSNVKSNPDFYSREVAIFALNQLALRGNKSALKGLLAAVNEPNLNLRFSLVNMISSFAKKGDKTVFLALKHVINNNDSHIRLTALRGLVPFAKRKDPRVFEIAYKFVAVKSNEEHEAALTLINTLASKKYKPAIEFLEKYKGFKREIKVKPKSARGF